MAASMIRCACAKGRYLIRSSIKETYCKQKRWIRFKKEYLEYVPKAVPYQSYPEESLEERYPEVEVSAEDFKYVEKLMPEKTVPLPPNHEEYPTPSGWFPPDMSMGDRPYYIRRTRNHMLPVYLETHKISRQVTTKVRNVIGDMRVLDQEMKQHLKEVTGKDVDSQVHEVGRFIRYRGRYNDIIAKYLLDKGF